MSKRLVIIDGKSVFYRGYYAMPSLSTKDGTPTGGVYGFAVMALEVVKKLQPDYVCVAWDKAKTNIRSRRELYPEYKANRKPAPPDFYEQIPLLHDLLQSLGWPLYELDDYEADDLMGAFAKQAGEKGIESYLVTSDLDVLQLVNEHTHIYTLKKGLSNIELFNVASFEEKYGVSAHQWVDVKALKGDSSDNIPGVAGVGEKTALDLIKQYKTLDAIYEHLDDLKPTLRAKLEKDREMAYLSKKLVTLMVDAPLQMDFEHSALGDGATPEFVAMLRKLEFKNLLRQAEAQLPKGAPATPTAISMTPAQLVPFEKLSLKAGEARLLMINPAQTGLWVSDAASRVAVLALGDEYPFAAEQQSLLGEPAQDKPFRAFDASLVAQLANGPVIGHDLRPMLRALFAKGVDWPGEIGHDTRLGAFILNSLDRSRDLSDLVAQPIDSADPTVCVAATWHVYEDQLLEFKEAPDLFKVAREIDFPSIQLLARVEHRGITLDVPYLQEMAGRFAERIKEFEAAIYEQAGQEFTIGSPAQLGVVLFEKLGLPTQGIKKGKTGYSTGATELAKLRDLHPIIDLVTQYREYTKLQSTYIEALPKYVDEQSKIHTSFLQDVAATGRLSSQNPNLQNIPTRTDIGQAIRRAFIPAKGKKFISADYSQFELRLAAVMANDTELIDLFNKGEDIHKVTAAEVYGVPLAEVDKNMRRNAKVVNFGILYGMSPHGLSVATGMTPFEAKQFIERYFELRKPIREYMDNTAAQALQDGYVSTIFGRRRPTPDLKSSNFIVREAAKRAAINMPIQGTEADLMKLAMLKVEEVIAGKGEQILQVHDSILVEAPADQAEKVAQLLQETMETIHTLPVKLEVEVKIGDNWGEL